MTFDGVLAVADGTPTVAPHIIGDDAEGGGGGEKGSLLLPHKVVQREGVQQDDRHRALRSYFRDKKVCHITRGRIPVLPRTPIGVTSSQNAKMLQTKNLAWHAAVRPAPR